ncbi:MAG: hypothetical protein JW888_01160, partial [Pirellulales bacterium]|nr:hypothetical protein [Pirellulales bacterium]
EDVQALDELQKLIDTLQGGATSNEPKLTVFYLRNAEAKTVAERLNQLLAGTTPAASSGGKSDSAPTGILGNLGAAGTLGRITPSGPISITPDERLNALLVQAAPADVDMLEEVLRILDRRDSPEEIPAQPKPRLIPVVHTSASEIAQVVKDVYQEQLASSSGGNRSLSPPEMMMQMFRRGRGRGSDNSGSRNNQQTASKMSIGVDSRTNSLIVSAPEPLFEEVRELVNALDRVASQDNETVEVVALRESNPEAVRAALASLLGDSVQSTTASGTGGAQTGSATPWWNASRARGSTGRSNWGSARQGSPQPQGRQRSGSFPGSRSQPGQRGGR